MTETIIQDYDMSDDNILLINIIEDYGIAVKQLAMASGYSRESVYKFLDGSRTIPSIIWRVVFKKTKDARIIELITDNDKLIAIDAEQGRCMLDQPLKEIAEIVTRDAKIVETVARIVADGRIDIDDRAEIENLNKLIPAMACKLYEIKERINSELKQGRKR